MAAWPEETPFDRAAQMLNRMACEVVSSPSPEVVKQSLGWELELYEFQVPFHH